jgi:hypothetical protein
LPGSVPAARPRRHRGPLIAVGLLALVSALGACSGGSRKASGLSASATSVPGSMSSPPPRVPSSTTPSTSSTKPASSPSTSAPVPGLPLYVLPAPTGYQLDTESGTTNGPISPGGFDHIVGAGAAATTHFVHGYDITYVSNFIDESIESTLLTFASPADAAGFESAATSNSGAADQAPSRSTLASIPGSVLLTATKADSDGFYEIDVIAVKGPTLMVVEYANDATPAVSRTS